MIIGMKVDLLQKSQVRPSLAALKKKKSPLEVVWLRQIYEKASIFHEDLKNYIHLSDLFN